MSEEMKDMRELEARLAQLLPAQHGIDRDTMMYEAGRAAGGAVRSRMRLWQGAFGMMVVACLGVAMWGVSRQGRVVERVVFVNAEKGEGSVAGTRVAVSPRVLSAVATGQGEANYLELRQQVLERGMAGLPAEHQAAGESAKSSWKIDGLDAISGWQRRAIQLGGNL